MKVAALTCPKQNIGQILRSRTTLPPSCRGSVRRRRPPGPPPACPAPHRAGPACRTSTGTSRQVKEESTGSISQREGQHKCSPVPSHSTLSLRSAMLHRAISKALSAPLWIRVPSPQQQMCVGRGGVKLMVFSPPSLSLSTVNHFYTQYHEITSVKLKKKVSEVDLVCSLYDPCSFHLTFLLVLTCLFCPFAFL